MNQTPSSFLRVILLMLTLLATSLTQCTQNQQIPLQNNILKATEAQNFIEQTENLFLLDVRTPKEFLDKHLAGAINIPLDELTHRVDELPADQPILIYCRSGRRAKTALNDITKLRPELSTIYVLDDYPHYPGQ